MVFGVVLVEAHVAEFPALPFFTDAYLADTRHLTTEEHGAYLLLLMCAWRTRGCALKDDDKLLGRIAGVSPTKWRRLRPILVDFFLVTDGVWRQKKLLRVYDTVAKKVARNRINGSKGGRAAAARLIDNDKTLNLVGAPSAKANFSPGWPVTNGSSDSGTDIEAAERATKTKAKTKTYSSGQSQPETGPSTGSDLPDDVSREIAAAASLDPLHLDQDTVSMWDAAGVVPETDIYPTIKRIAERQLKSTGQVPAHLAYYSKAVLEARDRRVGAVLAGSAHAVARPAKQTAVIFQKNDVEHWRKFLGDPKSRFRADYLSQNWCVPSGHPSFKATSLGPDPRIRFNATIPAEIYNDYGPGWSWKRCPEVPE